MHHRFGGHLIVGRAGTKRPSSGGRSSRSNAREKWQSLATVRSVKAQMDLGINEAALAEAIAAPLPGEDGYQQS